MRYELRKLLFRRESLILFAAFIAYCVFMFVRVQPSVSSLEESVGQYERHMQQLPDEVRKLKQRAENAPTKYIRRDFEKALECYNVRYEYTPYDSWAVQLGFGLISMKETDIALMILVLAFLSPIFAREHECGMYRLIYTTKGGKNRVFRSKLACSLAVTAALVLVFELTMTAIVFIRRSLPLSCLLQPVQALPDLHYCPFGMTAAGLIFSHFCVRLCVCLFAAAVMFVSSAFLKNSFAVLGCSAVVIGTLVGIGEASKSAAHFISRLGLTALLDFSSYLKGYDTVNVFGRPVFKLTLALMFTAALTLCLFSLSYCIFTRKRRYRNAA